MESLFVPSITGQFANWRYFQVVLPVSEIVKINGHDEENNPIYKIKTVEEVEEIYSKKGLSNLLQRAFEQARLEPLKNYLLKQHDKYINNITVAIFGGKTEWLPIGIDTSSYVDLDENLGIEYWEKFGKHFGVIQLSGNETLFVLDGQHRIKALREAIKDDPEIGDNTIAITLIAHDNTDAGRESTRRLFTVINRYAKPVSLGESILLDEDDLSAIIVRDLIEMYPRFKNKELIALNKRGNLILPKDDLKFSTVIALWQINEKLIPHNVYPPYEGGKNNLVRVRPDDDVIKKYRKQIFAFWDLFFNLFPKAAAFVSTPTVKYRNPGLFTLRPIGQMLWTDFYLEMKLLKRKDFEIIKKIPEELNKPFWKNILYEPISGTITGTESYAREYLFYMLGFSMSRAKKSNLLEKYRKYSQNERAVLPKPIINK